MSYITNVLEYLETSAHKHPHKIAFADETQSITYAAFIRRAKGMGTQLAKLTSPRTPVAVLGDKTIHTLCAFFACVYAGCYYVPLNPGTAIVKDGELYLMYTSVADGKQTQALAKSSDGVTFEKVGRVIGSDKVPANSSRAIGQED